METRPHETIPAYLPCQPGYRTTAAYREQPIPPDTPLGRRVCQAFEISEFPGGRISVIPDGCNDIVLTFDGERLAGWLSPSIRETYTFQFPACHWILGLRFLPGASYGLFHQNPAPGEPKAMALNTLLPAFSQIERALTTARTFEERYGLLADCLSRSASPADAADRVTSYCVDRLLAGETAPRSEEIAAASGYTSRYIRTLFSERIGHTPKELSSILRMQKALGYLWENAGADLSQTAQRFGFSDQSHMNRAFRKLFGVTSGAVKDAGNWAYQIRSGQSRWFNSI